LCVRKVRILIVSPRPLAKLIRYLLDGRAEFEILESLPDVSGLARPAWRRPPDLIVASVKPVGAGVCATAVSVKKSNPFCKLILICPLSDLTVSARRCGADALVDPEKLVGRLLPAVWSQAAAAFERPAAHKFPVRSSAANPNKKDLL